MKKLMFFRFLEKTTGSPRPLWGLAKTKPQRLCEGAKHPKQSRISNTLNYFRYATFTSILTCSLLIGQTTFAATPSKQVVVGSEDTVYGIAYNNGIPTRALIAANNLKPPYVLSPGQVLLIPSLNEHIVGDGETLETIAEEYGVNVDVLAQENSIQSPSFVTPGTRLTIPSRDTESLAEALKPVSPEISTSSLAPLPLVKSESSSESHTNPATPVSTNAALPADLAEELAKEKGTAGKAAVESSSKPMIMGNLAQKNAGAPIGATQSSPEIINEQKPKKEAKNEEKAPEKKQAKKEDKKKEAEVKDVRFIWPVEGDVISKFSPGGKNDGINIKVEEGTAVKASADGSVMYAGNGLKGFGNLLLIKHKDGWITAYAHNSELLVKKDDKIKQGQEIARSGKMGDVGEPQLHFEIRKGKQPIDPLTKLKS
jgi:murein DD-endopeptidase MepM/ murein hydrolase activator NlpD